MLLLRVLVDYLFLLALQGNFTIVKWRLLLFTPFLIQNSTFLALLDIGTSQSIGYCTLNISRSARLFVYIKLFAEIIKFNKHTHIAI